MTTITYTFTKTTSSDGIKLSGHTATDQRAVEPLTALVRKVMSISQGAAEEIQNCREIQVVISTKNTTSIQVKVEKSKGVYFTINVPKLSPATMNSLRPLLQEEQPSSPPTQAPAPEQPAAAKPPITEPIALQPSAPTSLKLPGIYNPNTNCFMNATFQMVMNDTELRKALFDTFTIEKAKCEAKRAEIKNKIKPLNTELEKEKQKFLYWFNDSYNQCCARLKELQDELKNQDDLYNTYKTFLDAVDIYEKRKKETIDLTPLRHLLTIYPGSGSSGQCDAEEFFNALFYKVEDLKKYQIGYDEAFERTYAPLDSDSKLAKETYIQDRLGQIKEDDLIQLQPGNKRTNSNGRNITLTLDLDDAIKEAKKAKEAKKVKEVIKLSGQELLDSLFMPRNVERPELQSPTACKAPITCKRGYYVMQTEKKAFETPPQRFLVHLKRFTFAGVASKISELVSMPELITIEKKDYRLKAIIYHLGGASGGHYIAYLKKDNIWIEANDTYVDKAEPSAVDKARENGYLYLYEATDKMEPID